MATPRRRGASPGNTNALKNGFYSPLLRTSTPSGEQVSGFSGLTDEITILRVLMRRILDQSHSGIDLSELMSVARVLSLASGTVSRLIRTQEFLAGSSREFRKKLDQTLEEALHDLPHDELAPSSEPGE